MPHTTPKYTAAIRIASTPANAAAQNVKNRSHSSPARIRLNKIQVISRVPFIRLLRRRSIRFKDVAADSGKQSIVNIQTISPAEIEVGGTGRATDDDDSVRVGSAGTYCPFAAKLLVATSTNAGVFVLLVGVARPSRFHLVRR